MASGGVSACWNLRISLMGPEQEIIEVPSDFRKEGPFYGAVDGFDPLGGISGWVVAHDGSEEAVLVEAVYGGERIGSASADTSRSDIAKLLGRDVLCAFTFRWSDFDSELVMRLAENGDRRVRFVVGSKRYGLTCLHGDITLGQIAERMPRPSSISYWQGSKDTLFEAIRSKRRVAIIASFTNQRFLLSYHRSLINRLAAAGYAVIQVHSEARTSLREQADSIENLSCLIRRGNSGYDFASWAAGIELLADAWRSVDELLLVNDSNFGKVDLVFPALDRSDGQFICLTDSYETSYHAQSYFMLFRKGALHEGAVLDFFETYAFPSVKEEVIRHGELGLTRGMLACGIELTPLCPYQRVASRWLDELPATIERVREIYHDLGLWRPRALENRLETFAHVAEAIINNKPLNPSHFFWRTLISGFNHPFVKRELIMKNPAHVPDLLLAFMTDEAAGVLDKSEILQYARLEGGSPIMELERRTEDMLEAEGPRRAGPQERAA